jgi:hypothetical protein
MILVAVASVLLVVWLEMERDRSGFLWFACCWILLTASLIAMCVWQVTKIKT